MPKSHIKNLKISLKRAALLALFFSLFSSLAFAANSKPALGTITPVSGTSNPYQAVSFTATYSDADGSTDIRYAAFLLYPASSGNYALLVYDQTSNLLYLTSDINAGWSGGYAPGTPNTISNAYFSLDCSKTKVFGTGNTLTINWSITAQAVSSGRLYASLLLAIDKSGNSTNLNSKGSYAIDYDPQAGVITPSSGISSPDEYLSFTTTYSDKDSWQNIQYALLGFYNPDTPANPPSILGYDRLNHKLYLRNDTDTAWLGGFSPGSSNIIENSRLRLDCTLTAVQGSGNTLSISWRVSFKPAFQGQKKLYLLVVDSASGSSGWTEKGSWSIQSDTTPPIGTILINSGASITNSTSATLILSATDSGSGMGAGAQMQFSNDNVIWSVPENYAASKTWVLTSGDSAKTVYAKFKDVAGNWSTPVSDTIILDTIPPQISSSSPLDGATFYENDSVLISVMVNDIDPSPLEYQFSIDGIIKQAWSSLSTSYSWITSLQDKGSHNIKVEAKDAGGQDSKEMEIYILRKPIPPI